MGKNPFSGFKILAFLRPPRVSFIPHPRFDRGVKFRLSSFLGACRRLPRIFSRRHSLSSWYLRKIVTFRGSDSLLCSASMLLRGPPPSLPVSFVEFHLRAATFATKPDGPMRTGCALVCPNANLVSRNWLIPKYMRGKNSSWHL